MVVFYHGIIVSDDDILNKTNELSVDKFRNCNPTQICEEAQMKVMDHLFALTPAYLINISISLLELTSLVFVVNSIIKAIKV